MSRHSGPSLVALGIFAAAMLTLASVRLDRRLGVIRGDGDATMSVFDT